MVADLIGQAVISAVNLQEVMKELLVSGLSAHASKEIIEKLRLDIRNRYNAPVTLGWTGPAAIRSRLHLRIDRSSRGLEFAHEAILASADRIVQNRHGILHLGLSAMTIMTGQVRSVVNVASAYWSDANWQVGAGDRFDSAYREARFGRAPRPDRLLAQAGFRHPRHSRF